MWSFVALLEGMGFRKKIQNFEQKEELINKILYYNFQSSETTLLLLHLCSKNSNNFVWSNFWRENYEKIIKLKYLDTNPQELLVLHEKIVPNELVSEYEFYLWNVFGNRENNVVISEMLSIEKFDYIFLRDLLVKFIFNRYSKIFISLNWFSDVSNVKQQWVISGMFTDFLLSGFYLSWLNNKNNCDDKFLDIFNALVDQYLILLVYFSWIELAFLWQKGMKDYKLMDLLFQEPERIAQINMESVETAQYFQNSVELLKIYKEELPTRDKALLLLENFFIQSAINDKIRNNIISEYKKMEK